MATSLKVTDPSVMVLELQGLINAPWGSSTGEAQSPEKPEQLSNILWLLLITTRSHVHCQDPPMNEHELCTSALKSKLSQFQGVCGPLEVHKWSKTTSG